MVDREVDQAASQTCPRKILTKFSQVSCFDGFNITEKGGVICGNHLILRWLL